MKNKFFAFLSFAFLFVAILILSSPQPVKAQKIYTMWRIHSFSGYGTSCVDGWAWHDGWGNSSRECGGGTFKLHTDNDRASGMVFINNAFPTRQSIAIEARYRYFGYQGYGQDAITIMPMTYNAQRICYSIAHGHHSGGPCAWSDESQMKMFYSHGNIGSGYVFRRSAKMRMSPTATKFGLEVPDNAGNPGRWMTVRWEYDAATNVWTEMVWETEDKADNWEQPYNDIAPNRGTYSTTGGAWWPSSLKIGHHIVFAGTNLSDGDAGGPWTDTEVDYIKIWTVEPASADLSITKTDNIDPVQEGGLFRYTLTARNNGPSDAGLAVIRDTMPTGISIVSRSYNTAYWWCPSLSNSSTTIYCLRRGGSMPANEAHNLHFNVRVSPTFVGTYAYNTATIRSEGSNAVFDPNLSNNSDTERTRIIQTLQTDVSVTKTDSPDPIRVGNRLYWTVRVRNNGPDPAPNLNLVDVYPNTLTMRVSSTPSRWQCFGAVNNGNGTTRTTCSRTASLASGSTSTFQMYADVPANFAASTIRNDVSVTTTAIDTNPSNNSAYATTTVIRNGNLTVDKNGTNSVQAGENVNYTLVVRNTTAVDLTDVRVIDTIPTGTTFVSASGSGWTCRWGAPNISCARQGLGGHSTAPTINVSVNVPANFTNTSITNVACVSHPLDTTPGDDCDDKTTTIILPADLVMGKSVSPASTTPGTTVTWPLLVRNIGPGDAANVVVEDTIPSDVTYVSAVGSGWTCTYSDPILTCRRAALAVGDHSTINLVTSVPTTVTSATITNRACVRASTDDPDNSNNCDDETLTLEGADLQVLKSDDVDPVMPDGVVIYTLDVSNNGPASAIDVVVVDAMPAEFNFLRTFDPPGWNCTPVSRQIRCTAAQLLAGATAQIRVSMSVPNTLRGGDVATNNVSVSASTYDPILTNNRDTEDTTVTTVWNIENPVGKTFAHVRIGSDMEPGAQDEADYLSNELAVNHLQVFSGLGFGFDMDNSPNLCITHVDPCPAADYIPAIVIQESFRIDSIHLLDDPAAINYSVSGGTKEISAFNRFVQPVPTDCTTGKCVGYELFASPNYVWDWESDLVHIIFLTEGGNVPECSAGFNCIIVQGDLNPGIYQIKGTVVIRVEYPGYPDLTDTHELAATASYQLVAPRIQP